MAHFFAERAGEALQRALRDPLVGVGGGVGCGADDDETRAAAQVAQHRREEVVQSVEAGRCGDAGGVENQPAELVGPPAAQIVAHQVVVLVQRRPQRLDDPAVSADQQRSGQWRITGAVAAKGLRLRNTKLFCHKRSGAGVDHLREQIGRAFGSH